MPRWKKPDYVVHHQRSKERWSWLSVASGSWATSACKWAAGKCPSIRLGRHLGLPMRAKVTMHVLLKKLICVVKRERLFSALLRGQRKILTSPRVVVKIACSGTTPGGTRLEQSRKASLETAISKLSTVNLKAKTLPRIAAVVKSYKKLLRSNQSFRKIIRPANQITKTLTS